MEITKATGKKHKFLYMVETTHPKFPEEVIKLKFEKNTEFYHESDFCYIDVRAGSTYGFPVSSGIHMGLNVSDDPFCPAITFVTPDKKEAEMVLKFGLALIEYIKSKI